jgi:hypothetical protein
VALLRQRQLSTLSLLVVAQVAAPLAAVLAAAAQVDLELVPGLLLLKAQPIPLQ